MSNAEGEVQLDGLRVVRQVEWAERFPRLAQGITGRAPELDFSLPSLPARQNDSAAGQRTSSGWRRLMAATGIPTVVRCRQVHGARVVFQDEVLPRGVHLLGEADSLVTGLSGQLIAVTVADCVPVYMLDPESCLIGLAHAGWRGTAAGVVEATLRTMQKRGAEIGLLLVHLGPSICGECYEVGTDVIAALGSGTDGARTIDLKRHIAEVVTAAGVDPQRLSISDACTRCLADRFFSYRGGDRGRRMCAYLGWPAG